MEQAQHVDQREFARIDVELPLTIQPIPDAERGARLRAEILARPSVWAPSNEATLRELAGSGAGTVSLLAGAMLELTAQLARQRGRDAAGPGPAVPATLLQLSGGGGRIACDLPLGCGELFELRFEDSGEHEMPPVRAVGEVVHCAPGERTLGFRFHALHEQDQALLMRLIYRFQRQALRRTRQPG